MRKIFATTLVFLGLFVVSAIPAQAQYGYMPTGYGWAQPGAYGYGYNQVCCLNYTWHNPQEMMQYQPMYYPAPRPPWGWQQPYGNYYGGYDWNNPGGFVNIGFGW